MSDQIAADLARLEGYTADTQAALEAVDITGYAGALLRYNLADANPSGLKGTAASEIGAIWGLTSGLRTLDQLPSDFAAALRTVDARRRIDLSGGYPKVVYDIDDRALEDVLARMAAARRDDPDASTAELHDRVMHDAAAEFIDGFRGDPEELADHVDRYAHLFDEPVFAEDLLTDLGPDFIISGPPTFARSLDAEDRLAFLAPFAEALAVADREDLLTDEFWDHFFGDELSGPQVGFALAQYTREATFTTDFLERAIDAAILEDRLIIPLQQPLLDGDGPDLGALLLHNILTQYDDETSARILIARGDELLDDASLAQAMVIERLIQEGTIELHAVNEGLANLATIPVVNWVDRRDGDVSTVGVYEDTLAAIAILHFDEIARGVNAPVDLTTGLSPTGTLYFNGGAALDLLLAASGSDTNVQALEAAFDRFRDEQLTVVDGAVEFAAESNTGYIENVRNLLTAAVGGRAIRDGDASDAEIQQTRDAVNLLIDTAEARGTNLAGLAKGLLQDTLVDTLFPEGTSGDDARSSLEAARADDARGAIITRIDQQLVDAEVFTTPPWGDDVNPETFIEQYEQDLADAGVSPSAIDASFVTTNAAGNLEVREPLTEMQAQALAEWVADPVVLSIIFPT